MTAAAQAFELTPLLLEEPSMTIVLATVEADSCARPVLGTAICSQTFWTPRLPPARPRARRQHPRGPGRCRRSTAPETAGSAIEQIVLAAREPDVRCSFSARAAYTEGLNPPAAQRSKS